MAIGTMTIVNRVDFGKGEKNIKVSFAGDGAYTTGGTVGADVLAALQLAIKTAAGVATDANVRGAEAVTIKEVVCGDCGQYLASWTGGKLKVLDGGSATQAEVAGAVNLSGTTFNVTFICD